MMAQSWETYHISWTGSTLYPGQWLIFHLCNTKWNGIQNLVTHAQRFWHLHWQHVTYWISVLCRRNKMIMACSFDKWGNRKNWLPGASTRLGIGYCQDISARDCKYPMFTVVYIVSSDFTKNLTRLTRGLYLNCKSFQLPNVHIDWSIHFFSCIFSHRVASELLLLCMGLFFVLGICLNFLNKRPLVIIFL